MPSSLLDKIKAMKIEDFKLNKLNQQSMGGQGRAVELTLKFIQVIYCEYKVDGSQRLSYVSTAQCQQQQQHCRVENLTWSKHILQCWCHCLEVSH